MALPLRARGDGAALRARMSSDTRPDREGHDRNPGPFAGRFGHGDKQAVR